MTTQEAERTFWQELNTAIDNAVANGLDGGRIAYNLRSIASDIGGRWRE